MGSRFVLALQDKEAYPNLSLVEAREKLVAYSQASLPCLFKVRKVKKTGDEYAALARQFQSSANVNCLCFTSSGHLADCLVASDNKSDANWGKMLAESP